MDKVEYPNNLCDRRPASPILKHLIESGHKINIREASNMLFKSNKGKLLRFIEALAIKKIQLWFLHSETIHFHRTISLVVWAITH